MRLLITRPLTDSQPLAALLEAQGHRCLIAPLLTVVNLPEALPSLDEITGLIFTSANGVRAFQDACPRRDIACYAVGDRTGSALRDAGFESIESAGGDVDSLAKLIISHRSPSDGPLLHVAGSDVAGDLMGSLEQAGFAIARAMLYRTAAGTLSDESIAALRAGTLDGVLLFSPRTATIFAELVSAANLTEALGPVTAWCLSNAVSDALGDLAFARKAVPLMPTQDALLALLNASVSAGSVPVMDDAAPVVWKDTPMTSLPSSPPKATNRFGKVLLYSLVVVIALLAGGVTAPFWMPAFWLARHHLLVPPPPPQDIVDQGSATSLVPTAPPPPAAPVIRTIVVHAPDPRVDGLTQGVIALQQKLAQLSARPAPDLTALNQVIADQRSLSLTVMTLSTRIDQIETALRQADSTTATTHALLLATEDLRQDLMSSAAYQGPFSVLKTLGSRDPQIATLLGALAPCAATGIPSRIVLAQQLDDLTRTLAEPPPLPDTAPWWRKLLDQLERLIVIRHVTTDNPAIAPDSAARLAATDLDRGDLEGAIVQMTTIPKPNAVRVQPWLAIARDRLNAEQAVDSLAALLSARLATPMPLGSSN